MRNNLGKWTVLVLSAVLCWAGCSDSPADLDVSDGGSKDGAETGDGNSDTDADTDTDTDADADSEAAMDTDSEGETDTFNDDSRDTATSDGETDRERDTDRDRPDGGTRDNEGDVELGQACTAGREDWAGICSDVASEDDCPGGASRMDDCAEDLICCVNENECVTNQGGVCVASEEECADGTENKDRGCPTATPVCCYTSSEDDDSNGFNGD